MSCDSPFKPSKCSSLISAEHLAHIHAYSSIIEAVETALTAYQNGEVISAGIKLVVDSDTREIAELVISALKKETVEAVKGELRKRLTKAKVPKKLIDTLLALDDPAGYLREEVAKAIKDTAVYKRASWTIETLKNLDTALSTAADDRSLASAAREGVAALEAFYESIVKIQDTLGKNIPLSKYLVADLVDAVLGNPDGTLLQACSRAAAEISGVIDALGSVVATCGDIKCSQPASRPADVGAEEWSRYSCRYEDGGAGSCIKKMGCPGKNVRCCPPG